jgi:hypothetical protein
MALIYLYKEPHKQGGIAPQTAQKKEGKKIRKKHKGGWWIFFGVKQKKARVFLVCGGFQFEFSLCKFLHSYGFPFYCIFFQFHERLNHQLRLRMKPHK